MSPASKSKSKDKKAAKEPPKGSLKPSGHVNTSGGIAASGYNPRSGTFHTVEAAQGPSSSSTHMSGRFRNTDDKDNNNGNSFRPGIEYDSVSNRDSWSGESEDHKDKSSQHLPRQESVPGADNDRREKIRQRNEKKHQRQKERRAQELHENCTLALVSRKLEILTRQLVAMGFPHELAQNALIQNEGKVEESVAWILERPEVDKLRDCNLDGGDNLKMDISEELARISDIGIRYQASKQEVERAVVACEGDLERAEETLKEQKKKPPAGPPTPEETGDPTTVANVKVPKALSQNVMGLQAKPTASTIQQKRDEKDFNYAKASAIAVGSSVDPVTKSTQVLKKISPPKVERDKQQPTVAPAEKGWSSAGPNPSVSYSSPPQFTPAPCPAAAEAYFLAVGNELKKLQLGSVREPVSVKQQPQSALMNQAPSSNVGSLPTGTPTDWYHNSAATLRPNSFVPPVAVPRSLGPSTVTSSNPVYNQFPLQSQQFVSSTSSMNSQGTPWNSGLLNRGGASPTLPAASSLGLFSGPSSSSKSPSTVDWTTGGTTLQYDYNSIDWNLDRGPLTSRPSGLWTGANYSLQNNARINDSFSHGSGMRSTTSPAIRSVSPAPFGGSSASFSSDPNAAGSREWTSPFQDKDFFDVPRPYVTSPTQ